MHYTANFDQTKPLRDLSRVIFIRDADGTLVVMGVKGRVAVYLTYRPDDDSVTDSDGVLITEVAPSDLPVGFTRVEFTKDRLTVDGVAFPIREPSETALELFDGFSRPLFICYSDFLQSLAESGDSPLVRVVWSGGRYGRLDGATFTPADTTAHYDFSVSRDDLRFALSFTLGVALTFVSGGAYRVPRLNTLVLQMNNVVVGVRGADLPEYRFVW